MKDPNLIYPGSDLTNVFPEEGMDALTPTQAQIAAVANEIDQVIILLRNRDQTEFEAKLLDLLKTWRAALTAAAEVGSARAERLRFELEKIAWMDEFLDADGAKAMMNIARGAINNDN